MTPEKVTFFFGLDRQNPQDFPVVTTSWPRAAYPQGSGPTIDRDHFTDFLLQVWQRLFNQLGMTAFHFDKRSLR